MRDVLESVLEAMRVADGMLRERDDVDGPDDGLATRFYPDVYLEDWRGLRTAIAALSKELGVPVDYQAERAAPAGPRP